MDVYRKLPKKEHKHWDKFQEIHSPGIVEFVKLFLLSDEHNEDYFIEKYAEISTLKGGPSRKRRAGKKTFNFFKKSGWIK